MDGMSGGNPSLPIVPFSYTGPDGKTIDIDQAKVDEFIAKWTTQFNVILQSLWTNYASDPNVWQIDPENGKPLLLLYVGTDGPAFARDPVNGTLLSSVDSDLTNPNCLKVTTTTTGGTVVKAISNAFSVKYVSAAMLGRPIAATTVAAPISGVTFPTYKKLWTFREFPTGTTPEGNNIIGSLNAAQTAVDVAQVSAYRANGESDFAAALDKVVTLKPRFLILTSWNEFGSSVDEPSPQGSWSIIPNNKYGRRYSEILRSKVLLYKTP